MKIKADLSAIFERILGLTNVIFLQSSAEKLHLLLIFMPPNGGLRGCLLPSAKDVVLGRPLISVCDDLFHMCS